MARLLPKTSNLTIGHLTCVCDEALPAFVHAVALARESDSQLLSLRPASAPTEAVIPSAPELLARWERIRRPSATGQASPPSFRYEQLVEDCCDDPVDALLSALRATNPELVVAATPARKGISRMFFDNVAEAVAAHLEVPTLLLPVGGRGFVSELSGRVRLNRVLVAAGDSEAGRVGAAHAAWFADLVGADATETEFVHAGPGAMPRFETPEREGARFSFRDLPGAVDQAVPEEAARFRADLVVMPTRGHDSLRDVMFGTHTERVLHQLGCPLLMVPLR